MLLLLLLWHHLLHLALLLLIGRRSLQRALRLLPTHIWTKHAVGLQLVLQQHVLLHLLLSWVVLQRGKHCTRTTRQPRRTSCCSSCCCSTSRAINWQGASQHSTGRVGWGQQPLLPLLLLLLLLLWLLLLLGRSEGLWQRLSRLLQRLGCLLHSRLLLQLLLRQWAVLLLRRPPCCLDLLRSSNGLLLLLRW